MAKLKKDQATTGDAINPGSKKLRPVTGLTFYREDFATFLREKFQGRSVHDVAMELNAPVELVRRWVSGSWGPDKAICRRLGLRVVYAIVDEKS